MTEAEVRLQKVRRERESENANLPPAVCPLPDCCSPRPPPRPLPRPPGMPTKESEKSSESTTGVGDKVPASLSAKQRTCRGQLTSSRCHTAVVVPVTSRGPVSLAPGLLLPGPPRLPVSLSPCLPFTRRHQCSCRVTLPTPTSPASHTLLQSVARCCCAPHDSAAKRNADPGDASL